VALGITNQRGTVCVWERKTGRPLHRAIVWQDRRTEPRTRQLTSQGKAAMVRKRTGLVLDPYFSATKIEWLLKNVPGLKKRVAAGEAVFGTIDTWLLFRLTNGASFATDHTNASRTMLYDIGKRAWDAELLKLFGVRRESLPEIRNSSGMFGVCAAEHLGVEIPVTGIAGTSRRRCSGRARPSRAGEEHVWDRRLPSPPHTARGAPANGLLPPPARRSASASSRSKAACSSPARWCSGCATSWGSSSIRKTSKNSPLRCSTATA
jgi:hypothetical protein